MRQGSGNRVVRFDAETVAQALKQGRASLKPEDGREFEYKEVLK
jgi:hypothetical protein